MTELHQSVKDWLHTQKDWLQQAAELQLSKGALDDTDIASLVEYLKTAAGQAITSTRSFNELAASVAQAAEVRLKSVGEIAGIENLCPSSPLNFGEGNLCVIYGNNGSGKSGYARLVKRATGKPGAKELRPNVFKAPPTEQKCKFAFNDGSDKTVEWHANAAAIESLRAVDIFDSDAANNYLTRDNEATYTPPVVSLFDKLVGIANSVRDQLHSQQALLVKALPAIPQQYVATKAGAQYNGLKPNSNACEVQKIQEWTEAEEQGFSQLNERLNSTDPAALAKQKRARKIQIEQISTQIKQEASSYAEEALDAIRTYRHDAKAKRKIAEEAAQIASSKLDGVGSDTWKALWEAARSFSQIPYPQRDFPVVDGARCLLCHQGLAEDAKQRLQDLEKFVQGDVEQAAVKIEATYREALVHLPLAPTDQVVVDRCNAAGLIDEALTNGIKTFWQQIATSRVAVQIEEASEPAVAVAVPQGIVAALEQTINDLEGQAKQHDQDAAGFDRIEAAQKKVEFEAKRWTAQQSASIAAEVQRLKAISEYENWVRLTNTQQITIKGGQVAEAAITDAYVARFNKELGNLRAKKVRVKLARTRAERGKAYHGLQLEGAVDGSAKLEQVLSEGERRIISLAAFLADVAEKPHASTFIFDDPISSLDQDYELAVASRLVELAKSRQVLVFTHRLSLFVSLEDAAGKMGAEWKKQHHVPRWIETYADVSGQIAVESARNANTIKANNILLDKLREAKQKGEQEGGDAYRSLASGLCSEIRILLERTVEHDLLDRIVLRHRNSITTDNRLAVLANITLADCGFIDGLMTKYSALVHSQSTDKPIDIPEEPELKKDLDDLKEWRDEFKKRPVLGVANAAEMGSENIGV
jgi:energy-coupling factor transporter ATP-binding protein EcfA2